MKKRIIALFLAVFMVCTLLPVSACAANYYSVAISSYQSFRDATYGKGYDIDGYYGYQCWDGAALLWQQLGMTLLTGPNCYAKECWTYSRNSNAGDQFELIYNVGDVKRGDVVVMGYGTTGHIAFADADYSGDTMVLYGQNQVGDGSGYPFTVAKWNMSTFLGAFRYKGWSKPETLGADLGDDFYAVILNTKHWMPISKVEGTNNIYLKKEDGSARNVWRFRKTDNGTYYISNCYDGTILEMTNGERKVCSPVSAHDTYWEGAYQQWYLIPYGDGYIFKSYHYSDQDWVMDNYAGNDTDGNIIQMNKRNNSNAQIFSVYKQSDVQLKGPSLKVVTGTPSSNTTFNWTSSYGAKDYNLRIYKDNPNTGKDYSAYNIKTRSANIILPEGIYYAYVEAQNVHKKESGETVKFYIGNNINVTEGTYVIHSALNDNKVLDIYENSKENRANIQLYENENSVIQKFRIIKGDNYYTIQSLYSSKWLDIHTPIEDKSNVQLWESSSFDEEKWIFQDAGDGYVYIKSLTGYYLDVQDDKGVNNANVQVYHFAGNNSQKWRLEHIHSYSSTLSSPTCTEPGYTTYTCSCGDSYKNNYTDALGHDFSYTVNKAPTGSSDGILVGKCSRCAANDEAKLPNLNAEDYDFRVIKAVSCSSEGTAKYIWKIKDCGIFEFTVTLPKTEHKYAAHNTAPTCTEKGYTTYTCACGDSYKDNYVDALGHKGKIDNRKVASCTEAGYTGDEYCVVCGETINAGVAIPAFGHDFKDGKCTRCGVSNNPFTDIGGVSQSFRDAILWSYSNGIAAGTTATTYNPNGSCTRGQVVTFLWRAAGQPAPTSGYNPFNDVKSSAYYYKAILWAVENGITSGYNNADGSKSFRPGATVTRAQFVTFLWRYLGSPAPKTTVNPFNDVAHGGFYNAILWGSENGIVAGYKNADGTMSFKPNNPCTRAHVAVFLYRDMT